MASAPMAEVVTVAGRAEAAAMTQTLVQVVFPDISLYF
ncbi:unnamed protein product [Arabidopsis halleri]